MPGFVRVLDKLDLVINCEVDEGGDARGICQILPVAVSSATDTPRRGVYWTTSFIGVLLVDVYFEF